MRIGAQPLTRRELITRAATVAAATIITPTLLTAGPEAKEPEVTATEDLMREHGVLRRALLVYTESIPKIRGDASSLDAGALYRTGVLFRDFGENYHEKMLEEEHIFPVVQLPGSYIPSSSSTGDTERSRLTGRCDEEQTRPSSVRPTRNCTLDYYRGQALLRFISR